MIFTVLKRIWIALVVLVVVIVGRFTVWRILGFFGADKRPSYSDTRIDGIKLFNPKELIMKSSARRSQWQTSAISTSTLTRCMLMARICPWSLKIRTALPAIVGNLVAQSDSDTMGCRMLVDGVGKAERFSHELNARSFCRLKAA